MNVYDFDNTILRGDSSARFFMWCLLRRPRMWADVPAQAVNGLLFLLKLRPKQAFKQRMFHYLALIGDVDAAVDAFWQDNFQRVKPWYFQRRREGDVVISASPEFLVRPACEKLGIRHVMGSPVDKHTGAFRRVPRPQLPRRGEGEPLPRPLPRGKNRRILLRLPLRRSPGPPGAAGVAGEGGQAAAVGLMN